MIVEFKKSTGQLKEAFQTICAFLNSKGGTVLIGVRDSGEIIGQPIADSTRRDIASEIKKIEPMPSVEVDYIKVKEDKSVITIHVNSGDHAPYM